MNVADKKIVAEMIDKAIDAKLEELLGKPEQIEPEKSPVEEKSSNLEQEESKKDSEESGFHRKGPESSDGSNWSGSLI